MEREALILGALAPNVHVKIPITNTKGESTLSLVKKLLARGMKLNVTALFTSAQVHALSEVVGPKDDVLVSVFAGRLADTGRDPLPLMKETVALYKNRPEAKVLWASTREAWNIYEADRVGCDIITAPDAMIEALKMHQKTPEDYSLDTVKAFFKDSTAANLKIEG
jgi:transaldolase